MTFMRVVDAVEVHEASAAAYQRAASAGRDMLGSRRFDLLYRATKERALSAALSGFLAAGLTHIPVGRYVALRSI